MSHEAKSRLAFKKDLRIPEKLVLAALLFAFAALGTLLYSVSWQFDFKPTHHPSDYWLNAGDQIRSAILLGVAAAGCAGVCCVGSLALPHRLPTSGWAISLLSISGLLLGAVVLVGTGSAEQAHRSATSP